MRRFLTLFSLMLAMIVGTTKADYYVGEQIGLSDLHDGDLVIFEGAATSGQYGKYLTDGTVTDGRALTNRSAARIKVGLTDAAVWRVVSTGTIGKYYLQSVASGYYYANQGDAGQMADNISGADQIRFFQFPDGFPTASQTQHFDNWTGNPMGWNMKSIALQHSHNSYFICCEGSDMIYGNQHHTHYWNMFRVSTDASEGTAFSAFDGTSSTISGVTIDGLVYDLKNINTPSGNVATLTNANRSYSETLLHIPASVTYEGKTYRVNHFINGAFQGATFTNIEFESPICAFIGSWTFAECNNVTEIELPEGLSIIPNDRAFSKMNNLEKITFPSTIQTIKDYTFASDPKLTTIVFKGATPPAFKGSNLFGETTVPGNITIVVPSEAAVAAYTTALASYPVKEIVADPNAKGKVITDLSQISEDKYYFLVSQNDDFRHLDGGHSAAQSYNDYEGMAGYSASTEYVAWLAGKRVAPTPAVVWRIIKDGDNYKLKNLYNDKFVGAGGSGALAWSDTDDQTFTFGSSNVADAFTISNSSSTNNHWKVSYYHIQNYGPIEYNSGQDALQSWKIYELSDVQVQALTDGLISELTNATEGVGYVNGCKDEASSTAIISLLAGNPSYSELKAAKEEYIMPLTDGYYRLAYPKIWNGVYGEPYVFFGNDKKLWSNLSTEAAKADYSTVYKLTVEGGVTRPSGSGYTVVLETQGGLRPYYNGGYGDQKEVGENTAKAWLIRPTDGFADGGKSAFAMEVSQAGGGFHGNYYIIKVGEGENNIVRADAYNTSTNLPNSAQGFLYPATDITVNMHAGESYYWATLYVPFGVTLPEGTEAYVGQLGTNSLSLTSIGQDVPAATPVILKGNAASITATINSTIPALSEANDLQGQYLAAEAADDTKLSLGIANGKVGFYKYNGAIGANKAFVVAPAGIGSNGFQFTFDDDDVTGINEIVNSKSSNSKYYDLYGRKVEAPQKGQLYIVNGKVVKY